MKDIHKITCLFLGLILPLVLAGGKIEATDLEKNLALIPYTTEQKAQLLGDIHISLDPATPTTNDVVRITVSGVGS